MRRPDEERFGFSCTRRAQGCFLGSPMATPGALWFFQMRCARGAVPAGRLAAGTVHGRDGSSETACEQGEANVRERMKAEQRDGSSGTVGRDDT